MKKFALMWAVIACVLMTIPAPTEACPLRGAARASRAVAGKALKGTGKVLRFVLPPYGR